MIGYFLLAAVLSSLALPPKDGMKPVPGYDWMAPKKRAPGKPAPPPVSPEKVVADFYASVSRNESYDAGARKFVSNQQNKTKRDELKEAIDLGLSVLSPKFKHGLDLLDEDKPIDAAKEFEALTQSDDPFLSVAAANLAATAMIDLEQIDRCQAMLERVLSAHEPIEKYTTASDHFRFMLGYCQVNNLAYKQAYATFEDFLKNHPNSPERLRSTATQILTELSRRAPKRLGDVRDLLGYSRRKIRNSVTDDSVQQRQREAVALLDDLIDEAEEQEKNQGQGQSGRSGAPKSSPKNPGSGAKRSTAPAGQQRIGQLRKTRARPGEMWGKMPPKQRDQILQILQERFPSQYRELLEQYYKQLARDVSEP